MRKRLLATLLVIALLASLMTTGVMAEPYEGGETGGSTPSTTSNVSNDNNGVHVAKSLSGTGTDGDPYKLTLEAWVQGNVTPEESQPMDIVLVLDVSGSMDDSFSMGNYVYDEITPKTNDNYYSYLDNLWYNTGDGYVSVDLRRAKPVDYVEVPSDTTNTEYYNEYRDNLYALVDETYVEVEVDWSIGWSGFEYTYRIGNDTYESSGMNNSPNNLPQLYYAVEDPSAEYTYTYTYTDNSDTEQTVSSTGDDADPKLTLYYRRNNTVSTSKLSAMKTAVNSFIDTVVSDTGEHRIAIVKFAGARYRTQGGYNVVGDDTYQDGRNTYNYTQVVSDFSSNSEQLKSDVNDLRAAGATAADYGLDLAAQVFRGTGATLDGARQDAKKVVVFFTDGDPNHGNGFDGEVASDAVNSANDLKNDYGATVYTVGIFSGADPDSSSRSNNYMNAVSSNYPDAKVTDRWGNESSNWDNLRWGIRDANGNYYLATSDADELKDVFETIGGDITSAAVDETSTLSDTLSEYFDFGDSITIGQDGNVTSGVTANVVPATNGTDNSLAWDDSSQEPANVTVTVNGDKISVRGFDYSDASNVVVYNDGSWHGNKLVITFPIEVDEAACISKPIESGIYPTNAITSGNEAGLRYGNSGVLLDESPTVNVGNVSYNGTDITVEVYVDGEKQTGDTSGVNNYPLNFVTISRNTDDSDYELFRLVDVNDGTITYDFNIYANGYDCVDLDVELTDDASDEYVLQGIEYFQSYGSSGANGVSYSEGTYTVDNVTAVDHEGVEVKIYLSTKYSIQYYVNDTLNSTDPGPYISDIQVTETVETVLENSGETAEQKYRTEYTNTATLAGNPGSGDVSADGWYLNKTGTKYDWNSQYTVRASDDTNNDRAIDFYATVTDNTYNVTYEWDGLPDGETFYAEDGDQVNLSVPGGRSGLTSGSTYTVDSQYYENYVVYTKDQYNNNTAKYTFSGWRINGEGDVVTGSQMIGSANVVLKGTWVEEKIDPNMHTVTINYLSDEETPLDDQVQQSVVNNSTFDLTSYIQEAIVADGHRYILESRTTDPSDLQIDDNNTFAVTSDVTINYIYTLDDWNDKDDTETGGDDIPDKYQVLVKFEAKANGSVRGETTQIFTLGESPDYAESGTVTPVNNVTAEPSDGYAFDIWTKDEDATGVNPFTSWTVNGGDKITFYANFDTDTKGGEEGGDGTPDKYQATVTYEVVNGTWYEGDAADKVYVVDTDEYDSETGTWTATGATVGDDDNPIPTGMKPDVSHKGEGSWGENEPSTSTVLKGGMEYTYTYTFDAEKTFTVTITPANITAYVGGNGYAGVTDENDGFVTTTQIGLPEPGYHLDLSDDLLEAIGVDPSDDTAQDLSSILSFVYSDGDNTRDWALEYVGIYSLSPATGNPNRYVYSIEPATVGEEEIPVRLQFRVINEDGTLGDFVDETTILEMDENTVNAKYQISINPGELNQNLIKAEFTVGEETIRADVIIETGVLTVLTVADEDGDITNEIVSSGEDVTGDNVTAVEPAGIEYYVNDSEVIIQDTNRVQLLVDAVSNSPEFNSMMEQNAIDTVTAELNNPKAELFYLDLVDTENGNTKVTFRNGELTIYWPVPKDAAADSGFYVVHYTDMDRESTIGDISDAASSTLPTEVETINGQRYVTFNVSSFSPFALVYDTEADAAGLSVNKTDNVPGNAEVKRGDVVTYTVTVKNTGNVALSNIVVEDTLWGDGVDYAYIDGQSHDVSDGELTIDALAAGETVTITYSYTVTRADERAGEIVNHITATAGDGTTDGDTETTPVDDNTPIIIPDPDDDPDPVEPDFDFVPNWLNTTDHFAYIVGYEDGTIRPTNNITRAEVATIFFRLLTDDAREEFWSQTNDYTDVASDAWYNNAVSTLSNMGIIDGYEDGTFKPNASITRAEFTAIATRFFDYTAEYEGAFNDVTYSDWYADCVQAAVDMGLVNGYADGGFHPNAYITRAESCAIVNRVLNRVPHEDYLLDEDEMITWPDNSYGAWYYADMQEATNSHDYDWIRVSGEVVEEWTDKLAERGWEALEQQWSTAYSG